MHIDDLIFVGFHAYAMALHRHMRITSSDAA